jgi:hypothetical protein
MRTACRTHQLGEFSERGHPAIAAADRADNPLASTRVDPTPHFRTLTSCFRLHVVMRDTPCAQLIAENGSRDRLTTGLDRIAFPLHCRSWSNQT